ncbi:MAG: nitroreductase family protein [Syntrophales bacterium]|nr:nitroreductase family protein [Syntrophales bacterium]
MIAWEELSELTKTRRSIRRFEDKPVPEDLLLKALELATWAPNGGNQQPWRFLIVSDKDLIRKMADAVKAKTELMASWPEAKQFEETVARWRKSSDFFRGAPVCIVVLMGKYSSIADQILQARGEKDPVAREIRSSRETGKSSLQSVAAAVSYLCLFLHYLGLGTTWMSGPVQAKGEIEQLLDVSPEWDFVDLIPVGYPAGESRTPPRKPIEEAVQFFR